MSKYHSRRVRLGSETFDSRKEARRWKELLLLQKAGKIADLRRQVKFVLIPAQRGPDTTGPRGGKKPGPLLEHECAYIADYVYVDTATGKTVVEDVKGYRTADYIIKRKLLLERYGIQIKET